MKKTLIICEDFPLPETSGGNIRTMNFVRFFQNYGSVEIVFENIIPGGETKLSLFPEKYQVDKFSYPSDFLNRVIMFIKGLPYPISEYSKKSKEMITSLIRSNNYDYVLVRYIKHTSFLSKLSTECRRRVIVDYDDAISESLYNFLFYETKNPYKKFVRYLNKKLLLRYEKKYISSGATLFCSEKDRNGLGKHNQQDKFVIPNIYEGKTFCNYDFGNGFNNDNTLLFVGLLGYEPNIEGLVWFIDTIYLNFRRKYPNAKMLVVGRSPRAEVRKKCQETPGVELHADVPDMRDYYKQCRAVVVPILNGGGTRVKILEAALASRPILSTPKGAEGLDLDNDKDLLLFNNDVEFFNQYNKLSIVSYYDSLVRSAKKVVKEKYSKSEFEREMEGVLTHIDAKS